MAFSQTYTGKGGAIRLEGGGTQAQQGLNQMILEAEKLRYSVYEKNRNEFLKNANIDPAFVLSDSARKYMSQRINDFNQKWGKRAQETNYNLSEADRMAMQTERNLIEAENDNQLAQYELFKQHRDLVANNQSRYDVKKFNEVTQQYMESGIYDLTTPPIKALDPTQFIRQEAQKLKGITFPVQRRTGTQTVLESQPFITDKDAGDFAQGLLLKDDQLMLGALEKWGSLPETERMQWLDEADTNRDRQYSDAEQNNAIMLWMRDYYGKIANQPQYTSARNVPTGSSASQKEQEKIQAKTGMQNASLPKTYGPEGDQRTYSQKSFYFKDSGIIENIPTQGASAIGEYGKEDISAGNIDAQLVLYDPVKKVFLVKSKRPSPSTGQPSNAMIEIPEKNVPNFNQISISVEGQPEINTISDYNEFWSSSATPREEVKEKVGEFDNI